MSESRNILILERAYPYRVEGPAWKNRSLLMDVADADIVIVLSASKAQTLKNRYGDHIEVRNDD